MMSYVRDIFALSFPRYFGVLGWCAARPEAPRKEILPRIDKMPLQQIVGQVQRVRQSILQQFLSPAMSSYWLLALCRTWSRLGLGVSMSSAKVTFCFRTSRLMSQFGVCYQHHFASDVNQLRGSIKQTSDQVGR